MSAIIAATADIGIAATAAALAGAGAVRDSRAELGVGDTLGTAAAGLTLLMAGVVVYHFRAGDYPGAIPAVILGLLAATAALLSRRTDSFPARRSTATTARTPS